MGFCVSVLVGEVVEVVWELYARFETGEGSWDLVKALAIF